MKWICLSASMLFFNQFVPAQLKSNYQKSIDEWHINRIESLKKENG
jgi:hypothetical protein